MLCGDFLFQHTINNVGKNQLSSGDRGEDILTRLEGHLHTQYVVLDDYDCFKYPLQNMFLNRLLRCVKTGIDTSTASAQILCGCI